MAEQIIAIGNAVIPYIEQAEKFVHYSGAEKKEFVMTKANQYAIEKGFKFDINSVSAKIEELVALTKQVNTREKAAGLIPAARPVVQPAAIPAAQPSSQFTNF